MQALIESSGLVVVEADDYGVPDELITSVLPLFSSGQLNQQHQNYPHFVRPNEKIRNSRESYERVGINIARILELTGLLKDGYLIEYYPGEFLRPHRDYCLDGGYKIGLRLVGSGFWVVGNNEILAPPGKLLIQDMGKAVEHSVPTTDEYTLTAVWDFEL